ncbi:hypothetical protein [Paenibacillus larvae]|nr:hypothetical protein [Paenibacillus larvae]MCY7519668.1 hypothetical protein [Paenibacillus larvae]MCY9501233.1 hypothetical protein [Paenibacillus larvae]MCY9680969.1 hypothetical protein [Paenibacillus larvae]MCY9747501.1 hypothetical protein [Paenibacillus larvae]MDR5607055.1 hypothetical protein [Paenibacillus larvae]
MVDLQPTNEKLVYRSLRIIRLATRANQEAIDRVYEESGGHVKTAIVMILTGVGAEKAARLLRQAEGFVRKAVELAASEKE